MLRFVIRRVLIAVAVLFVASVAVFFLLRLAHGDPAAIAAGPDATPKTIAAVRRKLGLDASPISQYLSWLRGLVTGDLGHSYINGASVSRLIHDGIGNTVELTTAAVVLAVVLGGIAGLVLGASRNRFVRYTVSGLTALAFAVPTYVSGVLLVLLFAVTIRLFPAGGHESLLADPAIGWQYLLMPALCLCLPAAATIARFLGTSVRQVQDEEYMATCVAKGLRPRRTLLRHAVPNALPPVLTIFGIQIGQMLGGAIVVEAIFAWPGVGQLLKDSVLNHDYLVVQDLLLFAIGVFVVVQLLTDLALAAVDPRVRLES